MRSHYPRCLKCFSQTLEPHPRALDTQNPSLCRSHTLDNRWFEQVFINGGNHHLTSRFCGVEVGSSTSSKSLFVFPLSKIPFCELLQMLSKNNYLQVKLHCTTRVNLIWIMYSHDSNHALSQKNSLYTYAISFQLSCLSKQFCNKIWPAY